MPIDFTLTPEQRALQLSARTFARRVLPEVGPATRRLATPEARFAATRPFYEEAIREGFLQRLIPAPLGGGGTGLLDLAVVAEEFQAVDVNVSLTLFATLLGLMPLMIGGSPEQVKRFFGPFLARTGAPLAAFGFSEPGGSANFNAPAPAEGVRTTARRDGNSWVIDGAKQWVSSATGWGGKGADLICVVCRTDAAAPPDKAISVIVIEGPADGIVLERALESVGHRAHLTPRFRIENVRVPEGNIIGGPGAGLQLVEGSFTGTAALVGVFGVALMRAAFDFALQFARTEKRGGAVPIIEHQAVGYALADAKTAIEAVRALSWRACAALDAQAPGAFELSLQAKIFGSETAVRVITELMRVVGIDSYDLQLPLAGLLQDALAYPLFDGGNMGVRRRQLHSLLKSPGYDPLTASGAA
ncbi:MAG: acyl-CoA dehydrogenase family protein [Xanthobacteraceae bacterium]|nr:acyl-CoA dehydrogenase family protein [Xanthobacteraceae bacterium]